MLGHIQNEGFQFCLLSVVQSTQQANVGREVASSGLIMSAKAENLSILHRRLWPALHRVGKKNLKLLFQAENVLTNGPVIKTQDTKTQKIRGAIGKHLISQKSKHVDGLMSG